MKRQILCLFIAISCSGSLFAQRFADPMGSPEERAKSIVRDLSERVTVAPEKKDSLTTIFQTFFESVRSHAKERNREGMEASIKERDAQVQALLADEKQFGEYQKFMEERQSQRRKQLKGPREGF